MKLGIIIPTYNSLGTLKKLVESIYAYTNGEFQLIIVEDGQYAPTIEYLQALPYKNLTVIFHETNKGVCPSWNDGIKEAERQNCTHFAVINDDVELPPDWWDECQKLFTPNVHVVHQRFEYFSGWFFILDKYCIDRIGYFDEQFAPFYGEDTDYQFRLEDAGMKMAQTDIDIRHVGSATLENVLKEKSDYFRSMKMQAWQRLRKKYPKRRMNSPI